MGIGNLFLSFFFFQNSDEVDQNVVDDSDGNFLDSGAGNDTRKIDGVSAVHAENVDVEETAAAHAQAGRNSVQILIDGASAADQLLAQGLPLKPVENDMAAGYLQKTPADRRRGVKKDVLDESVFVQSYTNEKVELKKS